LRSIGVDVDRVVLSRTALVAIAFTFLFLGMVVGGFGPLLEHLTRRFAVSLPVAGATISVYFAGALVGVFGAMRAIERFTGRVLVMVANAVAGVGCVAVALAPAWPAFLAGVVVVGVGFGALVLGLNQLVAYSSGPRRAALLSGLNGVYSAGAVAGPLLVATFATDHFSFLYLAAAAFAFVLVPGLSGIAGRLPVAAGRPARPELLVVAFVVGFVLYVGIENGTGGWMASHLESVGVASREAAAFTSGFFLALMTGRLLMTFAPPHIPERTIVLAGSAVAAVALLAASIGAVAPWAYIVAGFAIAPIFPTGIVWLARLRPGDARASAWLFPAAAVGGIVGPGAIGLVIAGFGVGWTPIVLAAVAAGMLLAFYRAGELA
jgi:FHS family glucose/mannose:H+ symporter-like MFS transporter